jgi:hypothetical protein
MSVQKKSLISNTAVKKTQSASQPEQTESNQLKANSLAAHSMKKRKAGGAFAISAYKKV